MASVFILGLKIPQMLTLEYRLVMIGVCTHLGCVPIGEFSSINQTFAVGKWLTIL